MPRKKKLNYENAPKSKYVDIDVWHNSITMDKLEEIRRTLAKRSNQRLVRLEREQSEVTGEFYSEWGASEFLYDYLKKQNRNRASEVQHPKGMTREDILREITVLQGFLKSDTASVGGQRAIERARIRTLQTEGVTTIAGATRNRAIGVATNKQFYDFLKSKTFKELSKAMDSEQIIEFYDRKAEEGMSLEQIAEQFAQFRADDETPKTYKQLTQKFGTYTLR